jgi:nucleoid-associated protein YgaU
MGLFEFVKDAGERLFGKDEEPQQDGNEAMEAALRRRIARAGLKAEGLEIAFNDGVVSVRGEAPDHEMREKIVLAVGNSRGVARVDDLLKVSATAPPQMAEAAVAAASVSEDQPAEAIESVMYTVQRGDTLSAIAKEHYGNAGKYMVIFEANKPLLEDPDRIYPGQVLRIPPIAK